MIFPDQSEIIQMVNRFLAFTELECLSPGISRAINQLSLFFDPEYGGDMFLRNVG
jgi:hypothetical protein